MGWWNQAADGASLQVENTGLYWGDGPADLVDNAIYTWKRQQPDLTPEQFEGMMMLAFHAKRGDVVAQVLRPDVVNRAVVEIFNEFNETWGRDPSEEEFLAGLHFSTSVWDDEDE